MERSNSPNPRNSGAGLFTFLLTFIFILTLIGASGYLYWEKEKLTYEYLVNIEKMNKKTAELKDLLAEERKEKEKREITLKEIEERYHDLELQYSQTKEELKEAVSFKEIFTDKFDSIDNFSGKNWEKLESLLGKLNKELTTISAATTTLLEKENQRSYKRKTTKDADSVELPPVVVKEVQQATAAVPRKPLVAVNQAVSPIGDAQIMSINEEHNFIVLNKGLVDGIKMGDKFKIVRNGEPVAKITISEIRDFVSLGLIDYKKEGIALKKGDNLLHNNEL